MNNNFFSTPVDLKDINITDEFWHREQELVRKEVIPYQWEALNDRVEGAAPSYCMRNFKVAGRMMKEKQSKGAAYTPPVYTFRGFEALPEDPANPDDDKFYGFVFQDTDFSKWIEAVGYSLIQHPDEELEKTADEAIDIVCAAQLENGYLDTYYIINGMDRAFKNLRDHHELYCLGHLIEGAVAYYQATGKDKLLKAAMRFADYCCEYFGYDEGKCKGYPGHEIAEMALVRLYQVTGEEKYLNLSKFFLDVRGTKPYYFEEEEKERAAYEKNTFHSTTNQIYHQSHMPVREQSEAVGHAVRAVYLYSGMADVARLTGDTAMYEACERLWNNIVNEKLYVTGGIGGTHMGESFSFNYDLPNDTAYSETCAAIGLVFFARRMLQINPDRKYSDVMELALYNTVLAGMALDGKSFFYVNPLEVWPEACKLDMRKFHVKPVRQKWFGCACCPPNIARILSSVASYAYTESEDTLWTHLYIGSELNKNINGKDFNMKITSKLPWEGSAKAEIKADGVPALLAFRIPKWSKTSKLLIKKADKKKEVIIDGNGVSVLTPGEKTYVSDKPEDIKSCADENSITYKNGYIYIGGVWNNGDELEFEFDMQVSIVAANPKVRENIGKAAVMRGPVTYCIEQADNGENLHLCRLDMEKLSMDKPKVSYTDELRHRMAVITMAGKRLKNSVNSSLYKEYTPENEEDVTLRFIPYYAWSNRGEGEMSVWVRTK